MTEIADGNGIDPAQCGLVIRTRSAADDQMDVAPKQTTQSDQLPFQVRIVARVDETEGNRPGGGLTGGRSQFLRGEVPPQKSDAPAFGGGGRSGDQSPKLVMLADGCPHDDRRSIVRSGKGEPDHSQVGADDVGGHVFMDDPQLAFFPETADLAEQGDQDLLENLLMTEIDGCPIQLELKFVSVEVLDCGKAGRKVSLTGAAFVRFLAKAPRSSSQSGLVGGDQKTQFIVRKPADLPDLTPVHGCLAEKQQAFDVLVGIVAPVRGGPRRLDGAVAALPGANDIRFEAGSSGHDPDRMKRQSPPGFGTRRIVLDRSGRRLFHAPSLIKLSIQRQDNVGKGPGLVQENSSAGSLGRLLKA